MAAHIDAQMVPASDSTAAITLKNLAHLPQWVAWQPELRDGASKDAQPTKVPYSPRHKGRAQCNNPAHWGTRTEAEACACALPKPCGQAGIGLVLGDIGAGLCVGGVDLDDCIANDGTIADWAADIIDRLASYTEVSPSKMGLKVFFLYESCILPDLQKVMGTKAGKMFAVSGAEHGPAIELYLQNRYFTVTEQRIENSPVPLRKVEYETLRGIIEQAGPNLVQTKSSMTPARTPPGNPVHATVARDGCAESITRALGGRWNAAEGTGTACCPAHDDKNPSLSITAGERGRLLLHCFARCSYQDIVRALEAKGIKLPERKSELTLDDYARAKMLSKEQLIGYGLRDVVRHGQNCVEIPYRNADGEVVATRYRLSLATSRRRFVWKPGSKPCLYGLDRLGKDPDDPVFIVEGESDCHTMWQAELPALGVPGNSWQTTWDDVLGEKHHIFAILEPDVGGRRLLETLRRSVHADRIKVVSLVPHKDASALHIAKNGDGDAFFTFLSVAVRPENTKPLASCVAKVPVIEVLPGELSWIVREAEAALIAHNAPIYQRGGKMLMTPVEVVVPASRGRETIVVELSELSRPEISCRLSEVAHFEKFDIRMGAMRRVNAPVEVAEALRKNKGRWAFPVVRGMLAAPTLRSDGTVLDVRGYDPATKLLYLPDPNLDIPPIPTVPSRDDADRALALLNELFGEFPFANDVDRAVALSGLISSLMRGAVGTVPMHLFTAPTAGTGKSLLVDTIAVVATGRLCPVSGFGKSLEEAEKRLVARLLSGCPIISIDNISTFVEGDILCQAVERPALALRPLGTSVDIEVENHATIFGTGNSVRVAGDMTRRVLICRLDAKMERPELRKFRNDPIVRVMDDRGGYIAAVLTIALAYRAAGMPGRLPRLGSFEDWSDVVRSPLVWLGCADPVASMEQARDGDPKLQELQAVINAWRGLIDISDRFPAAAEQGFLLGEKETVRTMVECADQRLKPEFKDYAHRQNGQCILDWYDALMQVAGVKGEVDNRRLGFWLHSVEGRIVGDFRIVREGKTRTNQVCWKVEKCGSRPEGE